MLFWWSHFLLGRLLEHQCRSLVHNSSEELFSPSNTLAFLCLSLRQASLQTATSTESAVTERDVFCLFGSLSTANKPTLSILLSWRDTEIHSPSEVHQPASTQQLRSADSLTAATRAHRVELLLKHLISFRIWGQRISGHKESNTTQNYWWCCSRRTSCSMDGQKNIFAKKGFLKMYGC